MALDDVMGRWGSRQPSDQELVLTGLLVLLTAEAMRPGADPMFRQTAAPLIRLMERRLDQLEAAGRGALG